MTGDSQDRGRDRTAHERAELGEADTHLASGASGSQTSTPPPPQRQTRAVEALFLGGSEPRTLGRYAVLDTLGQGGMGTVLRAYDRELDRPVALKVLRSGLDERHAQRLRREAQAMARLSHPNVVQVYEVGEVDGRTFVAMELVKGTTLRDWMEQQPRPGWRACVAVFLPLGAGLAAAHEQGLVHRDFKPGNAIIDEKGRPRVLDFGLVRHGGEVDDEPSAIRRAYADAHEAATLEASLTETGAVVGTPAYMPPEQMLGGEVDARSDQFSFCVSLYEAVYGERPYEGASMMARLVSMRSGSLRPVPRGSNVPVALRKLLLRGLAVDPAERWPSMDALLEALARLVAPRRGRWLALAVGVGLVGLGGGLGVTQAMEWLRRCTGARAQLEGVWDEARQQELQAAILGTGLAYAPSTWERVEPRLDEYAEAWATEHTEACEATRVRNEQSETDMSLRMGCLRERRLHLRATVDELSRADATVVQNAVRAVTSLPGLERCADMEALRAEVPPPEDPAVAEQVAALDERLVEAEAKQRAGKYEEGLRLADEVEATAATLDHEPLMARARLRQGILRDRMGSYAGAVDALRQSYRAAVARRMPTEAAAASAGLVYVLGTRLARYDDSRGWAEQAEPWSLAAGTDEASMEYLASLGNVALSQGQLDEARESFARALAIGEATLPPEHPELAALLNDLGTVAYSQGRLDEARESFARALAIGEAALGPDHPEVAASLDNLGAVAHAQGEHDEARGFFERALAITTRAVGPDHPEVAGALNNLGAVAFSQGKHDEARGFFERALVITEQVVGPDHPEVARVLNNLGEVAHSQGKHDEARSLLERALAIEEAVLGPDHPEVALALNSLAVVASSQGKHEEARGFLERALAITEKAVGPDHPDVAIVLGNLGAVMLLQGKHDEARGSLERALAIHAAQALDPAELAETRFDLARALWPAPASQEQDRARARSLAEAARDAYAAMGDAKRAELAKVEAWFAEHRVP